MRSAHTIEYAQAGFRPIALSAQTDAPKPLLASLIPRLSAITSGLKASIVREVLRPHSLDLRDWIVLSCLLDHGAAAQREIAERTGLDKVAVNRSIFRLKEGKLVSSFPNNTDGRSHVLQLTETGLSTATLCNEQCAAYEASVFDTLTFQEWGSVDDFLTNLEQALSDQDAERYCQTKVAATKQGC